MGLLDVGYHYIIERDGTVIETRNHEAIGSACPGLNHLSVQLCLLGGLSEDAVFEDNITFDQKVSTMKLLESLTLRYPNAKIKGHDELVKFSSRTHRCPCWSAEDVRQDFKMWLATGVLP
jgi:N-acetylmuramoyl-L-alanine amidase